MYVSSQFDLEVSKFALFVSGMAGLAVTWISGYRMWKQKGGLHGYHESSLYHDFGDETAGALVTDYYLHRITGPAYALSQVFLAGPLWILSSFTLLRSVIPYSDLLESRLVTTLKTLREVRKWQGLTDHPDLRTEILYLAQMRLIDFSITRDVVRFKAA